MSCSVVSEFLQLHGLQPARLLCSWDSPGKNTRVGCHVLLQGIFLTQGWNLGLLHCWPTLHSEPPVSKLIGYIIAQGREATLHHNYQFCSVAQLCPSLRDPMARPASLFITNSQSLLKLMSIDSVMPSNHLILCHPLLLLLSILPSIRVFSNESVLRIRWPKYWSLNKLFFVSYSSCIYHFLIQFAESSNQNTYQAVSSNWHL